ncbi:hypothetical protein D3C87_1111230 [compost metagenome]
MHSDKPTPNPWVELLRSARRLLDEHNRLIMEKNGMQIAIFDNQIIVWGDNHQPIMRLNILYPNSNVDYYKDGWDHAKATQLFNSL